MSRLEQPNMARALVLNMAGLLHCSGCTEPNDVVTDTPEMANPQFDCVAVNSCPNRPSGQGTTDPIHNIMVRVTARLHAVSMWLVAGERRQSRQLT